MPTTYRFASSDGREFDITSGSYVEAESEATQRASGPVTWRGRAPPKGGDVPSWASSPEQADHVRQMQAMIRLLNEKDEEIERLRVAENKVLEHAVPAGSGTICLRDNDGSRAALKTLRDAASADTE